MDKLTQHGSIQIFFLILFISAIFIGLFLTQNQTGFLAQAKKPKKTPFPSPTSNALFTTWTEDWTNPNYLERWDIVTDNCFSVNSGVMEMNNCQAGGITSKQKWDKNYEIIVEGTVAAENSVADEYNIKRYWGGLTLFNRYINPSGYDDSRYGEIAVQSEVPPTYGLKDSIITLTNEYAANLKIIQPATPKQFYKFKIHFKQDGKKGKKSSGYKYFYYVNDSLVHSYPSSMVDNPNIFILCVATGSGGVTIGRASCKFGPITVTGVPVTQ
ncbi:hypothetical protein HYW44_00765 [Candidatus Daviesbacteria bacterium]|nr:hypothetical protein [Candidatus Daviesbacteria bacterium]